MMNRHSRSYTSYGSISNVVYLAVNARGLPCEKLFAPVLLPGHNTKLSSEVSHNLIKITETLSVNVEEQLNAG